MHSFEETGIGAGTARRFLKGACVVVNERREHKLRSIRRTFAGLPHFCRSAKGGYRRVRKGTWGRMADCPRSPDDYRCRYPARARVGDASPVTPTAGMPD